MKKITGFFMALLPFLVIVLLFATGLMAKNFSDKIVQRLETVEDYKEIQWKGDEHKENLADNIVVIPSIASDPTVYYTSSDENILSVEKDQEGHGTADVSCKGWGDVVITATAKQNVQATTKMDIKVWDNEIHQIVVNNEKQSSFIGLNDQFQLDVSTIPSERIDNPNLIYKVTKPDGSDISTDVEISQTGLITTHTETNGLQCKVTISSEANPNVKKELNLTLGDSLDSIGFTSEGTTFITGTSYNLYDNLVTYPNFETKSRMTTDMFKFTSSNPEMATISDKGEITLTDKYVPKTTIEFTADFFGMKATKTLASTIQYCTDVSFNKYSSDLTVSSFPYEIPTNEINFTIYPKSCDKSELKVESSDPSIVKYENGKFTALKEGTVTLTVSAKTGPSKTITDKMNVTIINSNTKIFNGQTSANVIDIGAVHYYPLRKTLNSIYENQPITWTTTSSSEIATLDTTNAVVNFKKAGEFTVTATASNGATDSITIKCSNDEVTSIPVEPASSKWLYPTYTIAAGDKFKFTNSGKDIAPDFGSAASKFENLGNNQFIAKEGSCDTLTVYDADGNGFYLIVTQDPLTVAPVNTSINWTHYVTDKTDVDVGQNIKAYPFTATSSEGSASKIKYEYTPEDETAVIIGEDNTLKFTSPTTVNVRVTCGNVVRNYSIKSTCGKNGKFSLVDGSTPVQSGYEYKLNPSETKTLTLDSNYVSDVPTDPERLKEQFSISSVNKGVVTDNFEVSVDSGKVVFKFTAKDSGKDIISISNGTFAININVDVNPVITSIDLYCQNGLISSTSTEANPISAFTKDLLLDIVANPISATKNKEFEITFNDKTFTSESANQRGALSLVPSENVVWKDGINHLIVKDKNSSTKSEYYINDVSASKPSDFTIEEAITEQGKSIVYLPSGRTYLVLKVKIDGLINQKYVKENFTLTDAGSSLKPEIYGNYIITKIPNPTEANPGYENDVTISINGTNLSKQIHVSRDIISKVEFVKHNTSSETDAYGLQRVRVFGNTSRYPGQTENSQFYRLPVKVYNYNNYEITDKEAKASAINSLNITTQKVKTATYDKDNECFNVDFADDTDSLYNWNEMFNNKFTTKSKNQSLSVFTNYGKVNPSSTARASYSFVVVDGTNVYDEAGIKANMGKKLVLQTNFGLEGSKESTPFTLTSFNANEVYGNGYTLNFDAFTKAQVENATYSIKHAFNIDLVGCNSDTFEKVNKRFCSASTCGDCEETNPDTFAYCTFCRFFQDLTIWTAQDKKSYTHIKNCLFHNEAEHCRVALSISDAGNTTTVEDCAFFNSSKIGILLNKGASVRFKGFVGVYNFHGSDMFDCMGWEQAQCEAAWKFVLPMLRDANVIQSTEYGADRELFNSYMVDAFGGPILFYDHTDASGKDVYVEQTQGTEKAANYLKYSAGLLGLLNLWSTFKPALPLAETHSPAFLDEFLPEGEKLNTNTRNMLIQIITRW